MDEKHIPTPEELAYWDRYYLAARKMQSGVAGDPEMGEPDYPHAKHLRVGVNSALSDNSALARLLIDKGLITHEEVAKAMADGMEDEVRRYEEKLSALYGRPVTLAPCGPRMEAAEAPQPDDRTRIVD